MNLMHKQCRILFERKNNYLPSTSLPAILRRFDYLVKNHSNVRKKLRWFINTSKIDSAFYSKNIAGKFNFYYNWEDNSCTFYSGLLLSPKLNYMRKFQLLFITFSFVIVVQGQVAINTTGSTANPSAMLGDPVTPRLM